MPIDEGLTPEDAKLEKQRLKEEKKKFKEERKAQRKEAKERAREIADREADLSDEDGTSTASVFMVTFVIVLIWIAILCLVVKLDFGGFGSNVLTPILKDVPVLNLILPNQTDVPVNEDGTVDEAYSNYADLREAVDYIKELELELERAQSAQADSKKEIEDLEKEVSRLSTFEEKQMEFQRLTTDFYEEVVYADKGPGIEEYRKYYEEMDPAMAEYLYKQVVQEMEESEEIQDYAKTYSEMKPKAAAAVFEEMTDNLDLVSRILGVMDAESRGKILGAMNAETAARLTKIMDPES
ncbi:MAG: hypothetical protein HFI45_02630 [Lachnospiraceae bacterium]|nr:hypothetical protein [Lachnospiraceae bacterium]